MTRAAVFLIALFIVPLAVADGPGYHADAEGDQRSGARVPGLTCADPALDVVASGYTIGTAVTTLHIEVADATASPVCGADVAIWARHVVRTFHFYTEDYGRTGYYVGWFNEGPLSGSERVLIYDPRQNIGAYLPVTESVDGNVYTLEVPNSGTVVSTGGVSFEYVLQGPADYYGYTEGRYGVLVGNPGLAWTEDRFGSTYGA